MARSSAEQQKQTRAALLAAAEAAFQERPISEVTLTDIAEAAGFTKGAVYSNFSSKNDLLLAVYEHHMEMVSERYTWMDGSPIGTEDLSKVSEMTVAPSNRGYLRVVSAIRTAALDDPEMAERLNEIQQVSRDSVQNTIASMAELMDVPLAVDIDDVTLGILSMSTAVLLRAEYNPEIDANAVMTTMLNVISAGALALSEQAAQEGAEA